VYGKFFASTFTGSMFGAGPDVFSVWGYVIANAVNSTVELNPILLAAVIGSSPEKMTEAIEYLCRPDPRSRNPEHDGRRLLYESGFQYHVVSHSLYRAMRNNEELRAYNRAKQQESRERRRNSSPKDTQTTDAQFLMTQLKISNPRLRRVIQAAIDIEKMEPAKVIEQMIKGYRSYMDVASQGRLRYTWGIAKFFSERHWASDATWPIVQAAARV
jgi:hypothetical protein